MTRGGLGEVVLTAVSGEGQSVTPDGRYLIWSDQHKEAQGTAAVLIVPEIGDWPAKNAEPLCPCTYEYLVFTVWISGPSPLTRVSLVLASAERRHHRDNGLVNFTLVHFVLHLGKAM